MILKYHALIPMILLAAKSFKNHNQITETLPITELSKHHSKYLIPTSEVLHIFVAVVLVNIVVKLSSVQKRG
jgi:hypothetical protein